MYSFRIVCRALLYQRAECSYWTYVPNLMCSILYALFCIMCIKNKQNPLNSTGVFFGDIFNYMFRPLIPQSSRWHFCYPDWGFSVLFLSCKANARVKLAKSGHGPHLFRIIVFCVVLVIVLCYCLYAVLLLLCFTVIVLLCYYLCCPMYWLCVLYHWHRVLTQLQLTNISYQ